MNKKYLFLLCLIPVWVFGLCYIGEIILGFAYDHRNDWWGGMPLWGAGFSILTGLGVLLPMIIIAIKVYDNA